MNTFSRRWLALPFLGVLILVAAGFAWYFRSAEAVPEPPPVPEALSDPLVERAIEKARDQVLKDPRSAEAWGELGCVFRANEINPQAVVCFTQASRLETRDARWPYLIGTTNMMINSAHVTPHLRAAYELEQSPDRKTPMRLRLAEWLLDEGQIEDSAKLFEEQLRLTPNDPRALLGLGMVALARHRPEEALSYLEQASTSPFARQRAFRLLATVHRQLDHPREAESYEKQVVSGSQDAAWPDPIQAECLSRRVGKRALNEQLRELESQGRYWEVASIAEELASTYGDEASAITCGKALAQAGSLARSEEVLRQVVARNEQSVSGHFFLGRTLSLEAIEARNAGETKRGSMLDEEAVRQYQRCLSLKPGHAAAPVDLGRALIRLGRQDEALKACRVAVENSPQAAETHLALGEALLALGRKTEAVLVLKEAARLAPPNDSRARTMLEKAQRQEK